jgi:hypothetical protein
MVLAGGGNIKKNHFIRLLAANLQAYSAEQKRALPPQRKVNAIPYSYVIADGIF